MPRLIFLTSLIIYLAATTGAVLATVSVLKMRPGIGAGIFIFSLGTLAMTQSTAASRRPAGSTD